MLLNGSCGDDFVKEAQTREVTEILRGWNAGDGQAPARLVPFVYEELRRLARHHLAAERRDHTLQPTALVHEAYLRLVDQDRGEWKNRAQFFGIAAQLMRRILVDYARAHNAAKRGGGVEHLSLDDVEISLQDRAGELLALDAALAELAKVDVRKSRVVELRFFGGLTVEETAEAMEINSAMVRRDWTVAKAWLHRNIKSAA
ncbi:MAG: RNA polymerase subunit sigma-70 [Chthoniobacterales bacterium]|nr:MAG: RNA polymerase subunit sigma-70 [Chthoniobacterales bacterium]